MLFSVIFNLYRYIDTSMRWGQELTGKECEGIVHGSVF